MLKILVKKMERIRIEFEGSHAEIIVAGYNGKYILLFDAPKEVKIKREKILKKEEHEAKCVLG